MLQRVRDGDETLPLSRRSTTRRGPRQAEIALMRTLLGGPRQISAGPIGRCVKRGWCRALIVDPPKEIRGGVSVLYVLTDAGRALLGLA
ncbi:MAG TPA: hypothetical protein VH414_04350 [Lichenihabitans sp.]|jgi:hypothetical protein|nr:hypothetical protein [Lichenihabitans sp.]